MSTPAKIEAALHQFGANRTDAHYKAVEVAVRGWLDHLVYKVDRDAVAVGVKLLEGTVREVRLDDYVEGSG